MFLKHTELKKAILYRDKKTFFLFHWKLFKRITTKRCNFQIEQQKQPRALIIADPVSPHRFLHPPLLLHLPKKKSNINNNNSFTMLVRSMIYVYAMTTKRTKPSGRTEKEEEEKKGNELNRRSFLTRTFFSVLVFYLFLSSPLLLPAPNPLSLFPSLLHFFFLLLLFCEPRDPSNTYAQMLTSHYHHLLGSC